MNDRASAGLLPARFDLLRAETFVRGESVLAVLIDESVPVVCERLERMALESGHVVQRRHDIATPLREAGHAP